MGRVSNIKQTLKQAAINLFEQGIHLAYSGKPAPTGQRPLTAEQAALLAGMNLELEGVNRRIRERMRELGYEFPCMHTMIWAIGNDPQVHAVVSHDRLLVDLLNRNGLLGNQIRQIRSEGLVSEINQFAPPNPFTH